MVFGCEEEKSILIPQSAIRNPNFKNSLTPEVAVGEGVAETLGIGLRQHL